MTKTLDQLLEEGRFTSTMKRALKSLFTFVKPYKVYKALITQEGTADPTVIVLENTLGGEVVWDRISAGEYTATLEGAFIEGKTVCIPPVSCINDCIGGMERNNDDQIRLATQTLGVRTSEDELLYNSYLEIQVYPSTIEEDEFNPIPPVLPEGGGQQKG